MPAVLSKRPASAMMKRPSSTKSGPMNDTVSKLKEGWQKNETDSNSKKKKKAKTDKEDTDPSDHEGDDGDEDQLRDKGKGIKFQQMKKSLPSHFVHLYEQEALSKSSPRAFRTSIINNLFKKLPNGRYELQADQPMFQEAKKLYERKFGKDSEHGYPKSVLKGLYFQNSEVAFQSALDAGDVYRVENDDGKEFYAFQSMETGRERPRDA